MTPKQKATAALRDLEDSVCEYIAEHPEGVRNADIAEALNLHSNFEGKNCDYLSWSILGLLLDAKRVRYVRQGNRRVYYPLSDT